MPGELVAIIAIISLFGTIFGVVYLIYTTRHRERMALLERGETAEIFQSSANRNDSLKWGLVAIGSGIGLLIGNILAAIGLQEEVAFFSMLLIFGGAGLLLHYLLLAKEDSLH